MFGDFSHLYARLQSTQKQPLNRSSWGAVPADELDGVIRKAPKGEVACCGSQRTTISETDGMDYARQARTDHQTERQHGISHTRNMQQF